MTQDERTPPVEPVHETLARALAQGDAAAALQSLADLRPAEVAAVVEALPPDARADLWPRLAPSTRGAVLAEVGHEVREQLIGQTSPNELVAALQHIDLDALADIDHALPPAVVEALVQAMDSQRRERFEAVRPYPDDTAGGLMDADAISVRADVTLEVVLHYLRSLREQRGALPEHTEALMVVTHDNRYLGMLHLSDLVSHEVHRTVGSVMDREAAAIPATTAAASVARLFRGRDLVSAAVVDDDGRLLGRITVDDVLDVMRTREDAASLRPSGLSVGTDLFAPLWPSVRRRAAWLAIHLVGAFGAAWVVGVFDASIDRLVALAVLMPVVAAAGGVAGNQTQALVTRGLALEQVGRANVSRLLRKEVAVSLANGALLALAVGLVAGLWFGDAALAAVFGVALALNVLNAALTGTVVPLALSRLGFDPALGSTVVVTAVTDIVGFLCFLGLATLLLV